MSEENQIELSRFACSIHKLSMILQCNADIRYIRVDSTRSDFLQRSLILSAISYDLSTGINYYDAQY